MFSLLRRLYKRFTRTAQPQIFEYGRYLHKPTVSRAVCMVMDISYEELVNIINSNERIYLNDDVVGGETIGVLARLHAGDYTISMPSRNQIWTFFIR